MRKPAAAKPTRPDPKLVAALGQPSYTPAVRDLPAVIALLDDDGDAALPRKAAAALARVERAVALAALAAAPATVGTVRARGQLGRDDAATATALVALLADASAPRRRREAAIALGKVGGAAATAALLAVLDEADAPPELRRSVVEALGKLGGDVVLARLRALDAGADGELARRQARAALMIERDGARAEASTVRLDAPLGGVDVLVHCRDGLEPLLVEELSELGLDAQAKRGGAMVRGAATLGAVLRARLALAVGVPLTPMPDVDELEALARGLAGRADLLVALTDGPVRWRLDLVGEGHRRGLVWALAQRVRTLAPALINDPTTTTWDVVADGTRGTLDARPRRFVDARFAWRQRDVPAASHPTIAAALARLGGVEPGDVVWDPFCGSGAELIERALRGPTTRILGTDLSAAALDAARANVAAAGLAERIELAVGDARRSAPAGVTLVVSNPPLGRRIRGDVHTMLLEFARHAAAALAPGGRLVWVTPIARDSDALLRSLGLRLERDLAVDLGGFDVPMQRWRKPR